MESVPAFLITAFQLLPTAFCLPLSGSAAGSGRPQGSSQCNVPHWPPRGSGLKINTGGRHRAIQENAIEIGWDRGFGWMILV